MYLSEKLMNSLTYPKKMAVISVVFLIPLLIVSFLLLTELNAGINATKTEQDGLKYIQTLRQLYQHLPQHRGMTNAYRNGKSEFRNKVISKREEISADIAAIDAVDQQLGEQFQSTALWNEIKLDWSALRNKAFSANPQSVFDEHTLLIAKLYTLFEQVSNQSGLILDPKLNTYFIMDTLVYKLPKVTENMGQARGLGSGIAASGVMSTQNRVKLGTLLATITNNSQASEKNLNIALKENPGLAEKLSDLIGQRNAAMNSFTDTVNNEFLLKEFINVDATEFFALGTTAIKANYQLYDLLVPTLEQLFQDRIDSFASQRNFVIGFILVAISLAVFLFVGFYSSTLATIDRLKSATTSVSKGDLTIHISSNTQDETNQIVTAVNDMATQLNTTVMQISESASQLASSSDQLSSTTVQVGANISEQQSQTEQIATAMTEMTTTVQDIAKNAELLAAEVKNAENETNTGSEVINTTIQAIDTLASGIGNAAVVVENLEESSNEIGSILNVIKGVAEQTNLLALNAAIEAARAGDHGRGFAVVADEVRTLATRTQDSAEQIQDMVNTLQQTTREATDVMNNEKLKAEEMLENTQLATTSLGNIVETMRRIADMSSQVATAAEEQGAVSEEINKNVISVSDLSGENLTGTQQVSASSEQLASLANELEGIVKQFKVA